MKTASLGLLEVMVVRVNAGGDAPPDPPLWWRHGPIPHSLFSQEKIFGELAGKYICGLTVKVQLLQETLTNTWRA